MTKKKNKKQYVIGTGYPWYGRAFTDEGNPIESHRLGCIRLYNKSYTKGPWTIEQMNPEIVMLDPKETGNFKKYKLILEEI